MAFVEDKRSTCDEKLPELVFALNNALHSATGKSPAMLNYGRASASWNEKGAGSGC